MGQLIAAGCRIWEELEDCGELGCSQNGMHFRKMGPVGTVMGEDPPMNWPWWSEARLHHGLAALPFMKEWVQQLMAQCVFFHKHCANPM